MMRDQEPSSEAWKKMVLRSMPKPAWLASGAPEEDVVVSSRCRMARCIKGHLYPSVAPDDDLIEVQKAAEAVGVKIGLTAKQSLSPAEHDYLLSSRMISPEFNCDDPGRSLLTHEQRKISIMVNEEDHLRIQVLAPGYAIDDAEREADETTTAFGEDLEFLHNEALGFLTASPYNAGPGKRRSVLVHLIALAHQRKLNGVLAALGAYNITARGLFGESSKAVGAFFQISTIRGRADEIKGACEYLIAQERKAREEVHPAELSQRTLQAARFAIEQHKLSLADALRVLSWVRWARAVRAPGWKGSSREVDAWIAQMEVYGTVNQDAAARHRAEFVRARLEGRDIPQDDA
jgi:protein arginine kinase